MGNSGLLSWTSLVVSGVVAGLAYFVVKFVNHRRSYKGLPMPPHDFFWGHLKLVGELSRALPKDTHFQYITTTIGRDYDMPSVFYLDLWPLGPSCMIITDPDLALQVTGNHDHEKHDEEKSVIDPFIGAGNIVTSAGARWKHLHKQLSPAFSISNIAAMRGGIAEETMKFRGLMKELAQSGEDFRMDDYGQRLMFDIIGKATFSVSLHAQENGSLALEYWEKMCRTHMVLRESWNPIKNLFLKQKIRKIRIQFDAVLTKLVRERFDVVRRDKVDMSEKRGLGIMDLILRDDIQAGMQDLSPQFIADALSQVKTMLVAGTGTTSDTLCFANMFLSTHPEILQRLREEHDTVFTKGVDATYAMLCAEPHKLSDLTLTTNVIKEVLRFFPIGSTVRCENKAGFVMFQGQRYTTKGQMLAPQALGLHMDPRWFENPTVFDPDRFARADFPRHAWRPFERGPRACLGQPLAMDELKIVLLLTAREFDFTCANLRPNKTPKVGWSDLDLTFGDLAFQEFCFEAKPRDGMPMNVKMSSWS
ncbi:cytochrome P450 3A30 [Dothidotthia symphoricarpi CBS 119687]|uniref:Cytochrome P450 3A30 n=1 Tax=Dothidotthia symphoricarpi CBS 119687 TaxID=1392245 RepID=A0A6A6ARC0_9PLEO|nr:cytochrome P450 3A30 [Dothidotthia symphoricarpi CBS 119687]KAF2133061.1 cytochrome P450 3A30 [Dothidotthia symphoricarpi CBS 119687]